MLRAFSGLWSQGGGCYQFVTVLVAVQEVVAAVLPTAEEADVFHGEMREITGPGRRCTRDSTAESNLISSRIRCRLSR